MATPAPLSVIAEKFRSPDEDVRIVALLHAEAHGDAAAALAPQIAAMLDDPSAAVQVRAIRAFLAAGARSESSIPVLAGHVAKGEPPMLVARALSALGRIGPPARSALELVKAHARVAVGSGQNDVLEALVAIAPDDPEVFARLMENLFSSSYVTGESARRGLSGGPPALSERVLAEVPARLAGATKEGRVAIARLLGVVALHHPQRSELLLASLLDPANDDCVFSAVHGLIHLARRGHELDPSTAAAVVRLLGEPNDAMEPALTLLSLLGPHVPGAERAAFDVLRTHANPSMDDEGRRDARVFCAAATTIASLWPEREDTLPQIVTWLEAACGLLENSGPGESGRGAPEEPMNLYTAGDGLAAAVKLGPGSDAVAGVLVRLLRGAKGLPSRERPMVLDFERSVRACAAAMGHPAPLWEELNAMGLRRRGPRSDEPSANRPAPLPEFPVERPAPAPPRVGPLPKALSRALTDSLPRGRALTGLDEAATPKEIATAVDEVVTRARTKKRKPSLTDAAALASLYGEAVAKETGWTWVEVVVEDSAHVCLVSPDRAIRFAPLEYIARQLTRGVEVTALLLFSMIAARRFDHAPPGSLTAIG